MSHKDLCIDWVERRKYEREDGRWQATSATGDPIGPIYDTEEELEGVLWDTVIKLGIGDLP